MPLSSERQLEDLVYFDHSGLLPCEANRGTETGTSDRHHCPIDFGTAREFNNDFLQSAQVSEESEMETLLNAYFPPFQANSSVIPGLSALLGPERHNHLLFLGHHLLVTVLR